jgi:dihydroorotase
VHDSSLIQNGQLYDGIGDAPAAADLRIRNGVIAEIGARLQPGDEELIDATGLLVVPGLIDLHVHVFHGAGQWSIDPALAGLQTGVTTVLDTGSSGALTYEAFHRYIIANAKEDIFALLNISIFGCLTGHPDTEPVMGELTDTRYFHVPSTVACIRKFPDRVVGAKVRLTAALADGKAENEQAAFRGVLDAVEQTNTFLMVHHGASNIPTATMLDALRPGDVVTHLYHQQDDSPFEGPDRKPGEAVLSARERGIVFDVGHGVGSFSWSHAEPACREHGFWPDTISTDVHSFNLNGPVYDMPTTMSKLLCLGMPVSEIIRASTKRPAEVLGIDDRLGTLRPGRQADITLLRLESGAFELYDVGGIARTAKERFAPVSVFKKGVHSPCRISESLAPSPGTWSIPSTIRKSNQTA